MNLLKDERQNLALTGVFAIGKLLVRKSGVNASQVMEGERVRGEGCGTA